MPNFSILINTCDKFEDCWMPFFKLFKLYWPDCQGKIYLNTEYKDFSYPGLDVVAVKGCEKHNVPRNKRATWSQCLRWALEEMDTDVVLYMQEDYFLDAPVDCQRFEHFLKLISGDKSIPCIQLTTAGIPMTHKADFEELYHSNPNHYSYLSCQASLWQRSVMLSLIRDHETAWNFEWWGSKRAKYLHLDFLTVNHNLLQKSPIIPYIATGVVGGKWYLPIVDVFKKHNIIIDFSLRGFYDSDAKPSLKKRIRTKMSIWKLRSIVEIIKLKFLS